MSISSQNTFIKFKSKVPKVENFFSESVVSLLSYRVRGFTQIKMVTASHQNSKYKINALIDFEL